jgi:polyferredoxin
MAKRKKQETAGLPSTRQEAAPPLEEKRRRKFSWIPLWGWVLIFLVPLVISEVMFYMVGRTVNMILFPLAWVGFWFIIMQRSGWPILKKPKEK